jgi:peptide/nickel transport system ATP-binding protein
MTEPIVELSEVSRYFGGTPGLSSKLAMRLGLARPPAVVRAVDSVNLAVTSGKVVGLVGESGCGKSTVGRLAAGILRPTAGEVLHCGENLPSPTSSEARRKRLKVQMIFQDPFASLNPRLRVSEIVGEAPRIHGLVKGSLREFVAHHLARCGLDPAYGDRYPHELSGGQRQRVGIARALAVDPELLVCDESLAALDVSIQAQILNLFMDLREQLGLTYLFISHDLSVVRHISDRVVIMYLGRVVEAAEASELFASPAHPYTRALIANEPSLTSRRRSFAPIGGELPSPLHPPSGCHFHPRCPHAMARCSIEQPRLRKVGTEHHSACHLNEVA